ncbi:hypothetical protein FOPG_18089, partial [Fusarium oxysporum f. sp. conglutinans race 2 54008]
MAGTSLNQEVLASARKGKSMAVNRRTGTRPPIDRLR